MIIAGRWPRAIFYDSKTTLFDWGWSWTSAAAALVAKYAASVDSATFTRTWVRFFESHHRRTAFSQYTPVTETVREALMDTCNALRIEGDPDDVRAYTDLQEQVGLFADTEDALREQQQLGVKILIYSDVERQYLDMYVAKFQHFKPDFVGSTEEPRIHKPNPLTYHWVLQQNGLQARDVLYCAAPAFDVQGAMSAGLLAAWLRRPVDGMLVNQADATRGIPADYEIEFAARRDADHPGEPRRLTSVLAAMLRQAVYVLVPILLAGSALERPFPVSDHFDGRRFYNPGVDIDKSFADLWRMLNSGHRARWQEHVENGVFPLPPARLGPEEIAVTAIGHATNLVQFRDLNILTDPMYSERASPVSWAGPKRARDPGVAFDSLPRIDVVVLSHNHYDHMDLPTLRGLRDRWNPLIVAGLGNGRYLASHGLKHTHELDWWQSLELGSSVRVTFVPAQHWSGRGLGDRRRMLWGGYWLEAPAGRVYFAGDTGYPAQFREIRRRLGSPDLALLPIGAYEPRWFMAPQHVNPEEAVRAHLDLGAHVSIGMHFATFHQLSDEAMDAPVQALERAREQHGVVGDAFLVLGFGETLTWTARTQSAE